MQVSLACKNCGAPYFMAENTDIGTCGYCGYTARVSDKTGTSEGSTESGLQIIKPNMSEQAAQEEFRKWVGGRTNAPPDFIANPPSIEFEKVLVPIYGFTFEAKTEWEGRQLATPARGSSGSTVGSAILNVTGGRLGDYFARLCGTDQLTVADIESLDVAFESVPHARSTPPGDWPLSKITKAEEFILKEARDDVRARERVICSREASARGVPSLSSCTTSLNEISSLVFYLPCWLGTYTYQGQTYRVVIRADIGRCVGAAPRKSYEKLITYLIAIGLLLQNLILLFPAPGACTFFSVIGLLGGLVMLAVGWKKKTTILPWKILAIGSAAFLVVSIIVGAVQGAMERSATYDEGLQALNGGDFDTAKEKFASLGDYDDAKQQLVKAQTGRLVAIRQTILAKLEEIDRDLEGDPVAGKAEAIEQLSEYMSKLPQDGSFQDVKQKANQVIARAESLISDKANEIIATTRALIAQGNFEQAEKNLAVVGKIAPDHGALATVRKDLKEKMDERAFQDAKIALENKDWIQAVARLRTIGSDFAEYAEATRLLEATQTKSDEAAYGQAQKLIKNKQWSDAEALLQQISDDYPKKEAAEKVLADVRSASAREGKMREWGETVARLGQKVKFDGVTVTVKKASTMNQCKNSMAIATMSFGTVLVKPEDGGYYVIVNLAEKNDSPDLGQMASNISGFSEVEYSLTGLDGKNYAEDTEIADCVTNTMDVERNMGPKPRLFYDVRPGQSWSFRNFFLVPEGVSKKDLVLLVSGEGSVYRVPLF